MESKLMSKVDYINSKEKNCTKELNSQNKKNTLSKFIDITKEQSFWDKAVPS
ncbi:hypothetical protein [Sporomusa sp.]|uniref:hypothetical protein n=1 Tax=Sporomusa sp. TaxID=2078658 RepID=UPI002C8087A5|nr:hypothetical protein [Sporomusa sp.]HWR09693.1 hypothetical protein [Sporomusa sp.]